MELRGSCHCQLVEFTCESRHPVPFQRCYCSICRKTYGGGYGINIEADATTLKVRGREHTSIYRAQIERAGTRTQSKHERHFCHVCGSHLWAFNPEWPELLHPVAGAIDSELPKPQEYVHMMIDSRPRWVSIEGDDGDATFAEYPSESLADWHQKRDVSVD